MPIPERRPLDEELSLIHIYFLFREDMAQLFQPGFDGGASGMLGDPLLSALYPVARIIKYIFIESSISNQLVTSKL